MRITMVSTLPPTKGLSPYTVSLLRALAPMAGIDFFGFRALYPECLYPGGTRTSDTEPVIGNMTIRNWLAWYDPLSWVRVGLAVRTRIVHAQWWSWALAPVFIVVLSLARVRGRRVVLTVHNVKPHEKSWWKNALNGSVLRLAHGYIVHNEDNRRLFLENRPTMKPVHVIPHGLIDVAESPLSREEARSRHGFTGQEKVLLFFGNIREYKGLDVLLEALAILDDPACRLVIAGKPWKPFDGYMALMERLGLTERVTLFLDFVSDSLLAELFRAADLVVYPYREFEASSGAGSLALQFGKATVVTDVGGLPELVPGRDTVARPCDPEDLARKISFALDNVDALERAMRNHRGKFSQERVARMHAELDLRMEKES